MLFLLLHEYLKFLILKYHPSEFNRRILTIIAIGPEFLNLKSRDIKFQMYELYKDLDKYIFFGTNTIF